MMGQGNTKGPDPLASDQPSRTFPGDLTTDEQKQMVIRAYKNLKETFDAISKPEGDKNSPAKTCRDLNMAHPDKPSGEYWIDPNSGTPKDAILVYCDMDTKATCITPKPAISDEVSTGTPPITLFLGPGDFHRVIGKTVLKEECYSSKWENWALKNACVR